MRPGRLLFSVLAFFLYHNLCLPSCSGAQSEPGSQDLLQLAE